MPRTRRRRSEDPLRTGSGAKRRSGRSQAPSLEGIEQWCITEATPNLSHVFVHFAARTAALHTLFVVATVLEFAVAPRFTLWFRVVVAFRLVLLLVLMARAVCCWPMNVVALYGTGYNWKILRFFSQSPLLGMWLILGLLEHWTLRWLAVVLDIGAIFFGAPVLFVVLWVTIDVAFVFEFKLSMFFIYQSGVRGNVQRNLISRQS